MNQAFASDSRIAFVCVGGPENGPFSAMAARIIHEVLSTNGMQVSGIYTCSGSTPTALLGCVGDFSKLCRIWQGLTPYEIVGKVGKIRTGYRALMKPSLLTNRLGELIGKSWDLDRIFSSEAVAIKFQTLDLFSREVITFTNKDPRHKKNFLAGVLGTMAIIPFLEPQVILNPGPELIDEDKIKEDALLLVDGGYRNNMMLEEAMRDEYDVIFIFDVHGLKPTLNKFNLGNLRSKFAWAKLLRNCMHMLTNANSVKQYQQVDRINEEIGIKIEKLKTIRKLRALLAKLPAEYATELDGIIIEQEAIIERMNNGRLRLGDKQQTQVIMVSGEKYSTLFNFARFEHQEVIDLMTGGWLAAVKTLESLGFDTSIVKPDKAIRV